MAESLSTYYANDSKVALLSFYQLFTLRSLFEQFKEDDLLPTHKLGTVIRIIGGNPTEAELQDLVNMADVDGIGTIHYMDFLEVMALIIVETDTDSETNAGTDSDRNKQLGEAFRVLDKDDTGLISAAELRHMLTTIGDKLTEEEVDELMCGVEVDDEGKCDYVDFCIKLTKE